MANITLLVIVINTSHITVTRVRRHSTSIKVMFKLPSYLCAHPRNSAKFPGKATCSSPLLPYQRARLRQTVLINSPAPGEPTSTSGRLTDGGIHPELVQKHLDSNINCRSVFHASVRESEIYLSTVAEEVKKTSQASSSGETDFVCVESVMSVEELQHEDSFLGTAVNIELLFQDEDGWCHVAPYPTETRVSTSEEPSADASTPTPQDKDCLHFLDNHYQDETQGDNEGGEGGATSFYAEDNTCGVEEEQEDTDSEELLDPYERQFGYDGFLDKSASDFGDRRKHILKFSRQRKHEAAKRSVCRQEESKRRAQDKRANWQDFKKTPKTKEFADRNRFEFESQNKRKTAHVVQIYI